MRVHVCSLWLPKDGNQPHEYEDAFWPSRSTSRAAKTVRFAVADGATEASFSGLWAGMLVHAFGRGRIRSHRLLDAIAPLQAAWWDHVSRTPLPWYAEEKMRSGAFSSLLGLTLTEDRAGTAVTWSGIAVGDTCLFLVRDGELVCSFPISSSEEFDNSPQLISSLPACNAALETAVCRTRGEFRSGDRLYLLTDALACWFLARDEEGSTPWSTLDALGESGSRDSFAERMTDERCANRIRNDDLTMLRIHLE